LLSLCSLKALHLVHRKLPNTSLALPTLAT